MKNRQLLTLVTLALAILAPASFARAQTTAFTYQGQLLDGTNAATGLHTMTFALYDSETGGSTVATGVVANNVPVTNGLFAVNLDFGSAPFNGSARWLEIGVRTSNSYEVLSPRTALSPTPYAIYAQSAGNLTGMVPDSQLSPNIARVSGFQPVTGVYLFANLNGQPFLVASTNKVVNLDADLLDGLDSTAFWNTAGNSGTTAGANFLGTTDNQPVELKVNNTRAFRLEPNTSGAPNIIGGSPFNVVTPGTIGATIAGGGAANQNGLSYTNAIAADFATIGGGTANIIQSSAAYGTIGGGIANTLQPYASDSTIGGGRGNTIQTNAFGSTIGGGHVNTIQSNAFSSTISGGYGNLVQNDTPDATIGGGNGNTIQTAAHDSTIGGGSANTIQSNAFHGVIAGGLLNTIQTNAHNSAIGGGGQNIVQSNATYGTIAGGLLNIIKTHAAYAVIGGGVDNTNGGYASTIPGGSFNFAAGDYSFAAGFRAKALQTGSFVWSDLTAADFSSTQPNQFLIRASGGVGIGLNNPQSALHVAGTVTADAGVFYGNVSVQGNLCYSGSFGSCSDRRYKKDIRPLSSALELVTKLQGVHYNWRVNEFPDRHFSEEPQIGFIAQEVQKVLPEVVTKHKHGYYSVDYSRLTPVLVEALKEQQRQLAAKQIAIARLESELAQVKVAQHQASAEFAARFVEIDKAISRMAGKATVATAANR